MIARKDGKMRIGKGFSKSELQEVGIDVKQALRLAIPVDLRRTTKHEENIVTLRQHLGLPLPKIKPQEPEKETIKKPIEPAKEPIKEPAKPEKEKKIKEPEKEIIKPEKPMKTLKKKKAEKEASERKPSKRAKTAEAKESKPKKKTTKRKTTKSKSTEKA
jgi:ribosomal protein L13E